MNISKQTVKEATEIMDGMKKKLLQPFKSEKQQAKLINEVAGMLEDYKLRERMHVGETIRKQYQGFIPTPIATIGNRLRFLFTGSLK